MTTPLPEALVGLGCMRLSTNADRDEASAVETIHAALDAGANLLDTADVYALDDTERGHNERLIARALATWSGDSSKIVVATKGGLTRPGGKWVPDGRARSLEAAAETSRDALAVETIDLYQLHALDPRRKPITSLRALAKLHARGVIARVGLCNVGLDVIRQAEGIVPISSVQVSLSWLDDDALLNGVAEYCRAKGITLLAHSPLGGVRRVASLRKKKALVAAAEAMGQTPEVVALTWLRDLGAVPLPGATRPETARTAVVAQRASLPPAIQDDLDVAHDGGRRHRTPPTERRPDADAPADVVMIMGLPAAGKTSRVQAWEDAGHLRLNRDLLGGTLVKLAKRFRRELEGGVRKFVLDNTYTRRIDRRRILDAAWEHGLHVRCIWLQTSLEDAQINAVQRMLDHHGRLLEPDEIDATSKHDPGCFPPRVQFRFRDGLEPPDLDEGFAVLDEVAFVRRPPTGRTRGLIVDIRSLWQDEPDSEGPVKLRTDRVEMLRRHAADGWRLLGISWDPDVEANGLAPETVAARFDDLSRAVGHPLAGYSCPHRAGPPRCWCRRPLPGLGVRMIREHDLDPQQCQFVGRSAADRQFAERLGFAYCEEEAFFGGAD